MKKAIIFLLVSFYLNTIGQCVSPNIPSISASSTTLCNNQTATLSISSGTLNSATNWHWYSVSCGGSPIGTGTSIVVSPNQIYYVRGEGGCVVPGPCASVNIYVWSPINVIGSSTTQATCGNSNGTAIVGLNGGTPPYSYAWNTIPAQTTSTINNLPVGTWSANITDVNGCLGTASVTISAAALPSVTAVSNNILCFGQNNGSATLTVIGVGGFTYNWSNFVSASAIANGLGPAIFSATVTDANGCTTYTTVNIAEPNVLALNVAPTQTICYGNIASIYAQAFGGTLPYTYTLTNLTTNSPTTITTPTGINATPNPTSTTQFTVSVKDGNGCALGPMTIIVNVTPPLTAVNSTIIACDRDSIVIAPTLSSTGNGGPYSYNWSNAATNNTISVNASLANSPITYTVIVDDACSIPNTSAVITVSVGACVGIKENKNSDPAISFYPNPVNDLLIIKCDQAEVPEVKLFSLLGQEILHSKITNATSTLDLSALNNGVYYLSFYDKKSKLKTEKIIIQH